MSNIAIVILAAGLGKRMGSKKAKVLSNLSEKPLLLHVLDAACATEPQKIIPVLGHGREEVQEAVRKYQARNAIAENLIEFAFQEELLGTGHAVQCALPALKDFTGTVIILYGDVPLLKSETLNTFLEYHENQKATVSIVSFLSGSNPAYGRIIRNNEGSEVLKIVEQKDCSPKELLITEMNSGIYAIDSAFLKPAVENLENKNAQKEYYLTDIIEKAVCEGQKVSAFVAKDSEEFQGINTQEELYSAQETFQKRKIAQLLQSGVLLEDPKSLFIEETVKIQPGSRIGPNVVIKGESSIGENVLIEGGAYLKDTTIEAEATLKWGVRAEEAQIGPKTEVGPFAHLRKGSRLEQESVVGNFVEMKNSTLHKKAKAKHLSYLGDADIGEKSNIGAGTIFCNYDGYKKERSSLGKGVFIGSNSSLVAPVEIEDGATVGAGSTITKNVEKDALVLTRSEQKTIPGWSKKKRDSQK